MASSSLKRHILRFAQVLFTIWFVITFTFGLIRLLPGGPMDYLKAQFAEQDLSSSALAAQMETYTNINPNQPLYEQYINYMVNLFQGDMGQSMWYDEPVASIITEALPWSLLLVGVSLALMYLIGVVGGALMAYSEGTRFDNAMSMISIVCNSVPSYVAGVVFLYLLAFQWSIFPTGGTAGTDVSAGLNVAYIYSVLSHLVLPVASFVLTGFGFRALVMRGNSISILGEEYVRVARLRGLTSRSIALKYVGKNAVLPLYTGLLISFGRLIGATVIIEEIFRYRGLGYYMFQAIQARDYPLMMGCFIVITVLVTLGVYVADLTYRLIDPRTDTREETANITVRSSVYNLKSLLAGLRKKISSVASRGSESTPLAASRRDLNDFQFGNDDKFSHSSYDRNPVQYVLVPLKIIWEDWRTRVGLSIVLFYVAVGIIGPELLPAPTSGQAPRQMSAFQTLEHPFGSDAAGRDLLSLVVYSTRPMLEMILAGALFATVAATVVGIISGYAGGIIDRVLMTISDVTIAIPGIPLVIVLALLLQPEEPWFIGLILTINAWGGTARQIRSETLSIRSQYYVEASQVLGVSSFRILLKDILPNILSFILIKFVGSARRVVFASVGLYFLGVLPYRLTHWGVTMQQAYNGGALLSTELAYWLFIPMMAVVILNFGLVLFAQGTDRLLNPQIRAKHKDTGTSAETDGETATANVN
ncbi:hypothetical protein GCM10028857_18970 [Salinarchaeum chitinilyticum]